MGKRSRTKTREVSADAGAVGPRQPCPCGSGKRYKACHGSGTEVFVRRPFVGLPSECDLVAMRELVPSATAPLTLLEGSQRLTLCTLLPGAAPALIREDGEVLLALHVQHQYGDPARDLGAVLTAALAKAEAGESGTVGLVAPPGPGPRLQDLVSGGELNVTVHEGFSWWIAEEGRTPETEAALEQANGAAHPTTRLEGLGAAYWTNVGTKEHLRWVMPEPEDELLSALARLHVVGKDVLVPDSRFVGMFRAHGLLAPVWDLPVGTNADGVQAEATRFHADLQGTLAELGAGGELTTEERNARNGLANRQVTIR